MHEFWLSWKAWITWLWLTLLWFLADLRALVFLSRSCNNSRRTYDNRKATTNEQLEGSFNNFLYAVNFTGLWSLFGLSICRFLTRFQHFLPRKPTTLWFSDRINPKRNRTRLAISSTTTLESLGNTKRNLWIESATASRVDCIFRLWMVC